MTKAALLVACLLPMHVNAQNGYVGIGVSNPETSLDINGAITTRETVVTISGNACQVPANTSFVRITGTATGTVNISPPLPNIAGQRLVVYNNTSGGFSANLNGTPVANGRIMEFTGSGGTFNATMNGNRPDDWGKNGNGATSNNHFVGTTDRADFVMKTAGVERMRITESGNVNIGITTANAKLNVAGNIIATDSIASLKVISSKRNAVAAGDILVNAGAINTGTVRSGSILFGGIASGEGIGSKSTAGGNQNGLDFYTNNARRMAISPAGDVVINATVPVAGSALTVYGGAYSAGKLQCNNLRTDGDLVVLGRTNQYVWSSDIENIRTGASISIFVPNITVTNYPALLCTVEHDNPFDDITVTHKPMANGYVDVEITNSSVHAVNVKAHCISID